MNQRCPAAPQSGVDSLDRKKFRDKFTPPKDKRRPEKGRRLGQGLAGS
jgi:hypothetical protein